MIYRILKSSFQNRWIAILLIFAVTIAGVALASGLISIAVEVSGNVQKELRDYGANIMIEPEPGTREGYLKEQGLYKIKTVFWRHNILNFAPYLIEKVRLKDRTATLAGVWFEKSLSTSGKTYTVGVKTLTPWWSVEGEYPENQNDVLLGATLAEKLNKEKGDKIRLEYGDKQFVSNIKGIVSTGGYEDNLIFGNLKRVQRLTGLKDRISTVFVSAMTVPTDEFGKKDPSTMTKEQYERWYCTPYVTSVAENLEEVFENGKAEPVWQIADTEGKILEKLDVLIWLVSILIIVATVFAISTAVGMTVVKRRKEIGLMRALGADNLQISLIFVGEVVLIGLLGGVIGSFLGMLIARYIGHAVFQSPFQSDFMLIIIAVSLSVVTTVLGSLPPLSRALKVDVYNTLRKPV